MCAAPYIYDVAMRAYLDTETGQYSEEPPVREPTFAEQVAARNKEKERDNERLNEASK